jgi:hypothetical protein
MSRQLSERDGRIALQDHILARASAARARYGPRIDSAAIMRILNDREVVRYPVGVRFDAAPLQPGEFAHTVALGEHPSRGYCLFIHPMLESRLESWPLVIAYHIAPVNYGDIADAEDCELLGSALLGLSVEEYYRALCDIADALPPNA